MKFLFPLLFFFVQFSFAQEISVELVDKAPLNADTYFGTDNYGNLYYIKDNIFFKSSVGKTYQFSDLQLGKPTGADIINPLKIALFYKRINNVVFLDRHLVEINRVRFNALPNFKNLKFATVASNNSLWVFNLDSRQLEIFDYIRKKTIAQSQPVSKEVVGQKSNFNFCWLLTENTIEKYNIYGSLLKKIPHTGFTQFTQNNGNLIAKKGNQLSFLGKGSNKFKALNLSEMDIESFYLNDENLYIYDGKMLYKFRVRSSEFRVSDK